jgi:hypothetical protein
MNFNQTIIDIVYTDYSGNIEVKESNLIKQFELNKKPYSRDAVKDIVYNNYTRNGGYKDKETFTNWIFPTDNANDLLDNFDIDTLDMYEANLYFDFIGKMCKADALQIIINSVEGSYTQLSEGLRELAEQLEEV